MNKNIIEEIYKMRSLMGVHNNQYFINEVETKNAYDIIWNNQDDKDYYNEIIGGIKDGNLNLNSLGRSLFSAKKYSETIEQVEKLKELGLVRYDEMEFNPATKVRKKDVRRSKKMYKRNVSSALESADWVNGNNGTLFFLASDEYGTVCAINVSKQDGFIFRAESQRFDVVPSKGVYGDEPEIKVSGTPEIILEPVLIGKDFKTFPDNIITPNIKYGSFKDEFDKIVRDFVAYIKTNPDAEGRSAVSKLTNITIQGQADSANPTWDVPSGYDSLDHSYGGMKRKKNSADYTSDELDEMNLFLAENRAKKYKEMLINEVKKQTGVQLTITELEPISYRGQKDRRGGQWRSIILKPNAPRHIGVTKDPGDIKKWEEWKIKKLEYERGLTSGYQPATLNIGVGGKEVMLDFITNEEGKNIPEAITDKELTPNQKSTVTNLYILNDTIEKYNIGEYPQGYINGASFNFPFLKFTDRGGNSCRFTMTTFDDAADKGNVLGIVDFNNSDMANEFWAMCDDEAYRKKGDISLLSKAATQVPLTALTSDAKVIRYKGKVYTEVTNIWFGYANGECAKPGGREVDFYRSDSVRYILNN